jgi:hypothetical protein
MYSQLTLKSILVNPGLESKSVVGDSIWVGDFHLHHAPNPNPSELRSIVRFLLTDRLPLAIAASHDRQHYSIDIYLLTGSHKLNVYFMIITPLAPSEVSFACQERRSILPACVCI